VPGRGGVTVEPGRGVAEVSAADAPGRLGLVRALINTYDVETANDEWQSPASLRSWLSDRDLLEPGTKATDDDVARARALREALRSLCLTNHGDPFDPHAAETLNAQAARSRVAARFDRQGIGTLEPDARGIDAALGSVVAAVFSAMADGTWPRLKVCKESTCRWAFYDHSKNVSRSWCSMKVCGNRRKVRAFRERQRAAGA